MIISFIIALLVYNLSRALSVIFIVRKVQINIKQPFIRLVLLNIIYSLSITKKSLTQIK